MQLIRRQETWDPFREIEEMSSRMNRLFGMTRWPTVGEREALPLADWYPSCDISENDKEYRIRAELPNVHKDDVHVTLLNGVLTIEGERREEKEEKGLRYHRQELSYGKFVRRFTMPEDADPGKVDANFKDGMLTIVITKSKAQAKSREIAVH